MNELPIPFEFELIYFRIGGRIYTEEFGDGFVNPGANFIHDISKDNSVYNFAKERGLIKKPYLSMDR